MSGPGGESINSTEFSESDKVIIWQTLSERRASFDSLIWQTPALGMTAQAFLLTLALSADVSRWARLLAAGLSFVLALIVLQLMAKHRRHELLDAFLLEELEARIGIATIAGTSPHAGPNARPQRHQERADEMLRKSRLGPKRFWRASSYNLWMAGLALFAVAALFIMVVSMSDRWVAILQ